MSWRIEVGGKRFSGLAVGKCTEAVDAVLNHRGKSCGMILHAAVRYAVSG